MNRDRARGALLGLAVGDALGTTHEFRVLDAPAFPALATGPLREVVGGGPFGMARGQVTDDTQMACCLAASLRERRGFDAADVGRRYAAWEPLAFDAGGLTRASLAAFRALPAGAPPWQAGRDVWRSGGRSAAGNGSLMRTAPVGVAFAGDAAACRAAAMGDSAITHFDPRCQLACAAFDAGIAAALRGADAADVIAAIRAEIGAAADALAAQHAAERTEISAAREALLTDAALAEKPDPQLYGPELHVQQHQGFVRVAFRLALWQLMHVPSYEAALIDVVNRGGDADTNGAIVGALLGAVHGEAAIPQAWREHVLGALQAGPPGPFRDLYHPRRMLELAGD